VQPEAFEIIEGIVERVDLELARSTLAPSSASICSSLTGAASVRERRTRLSNKILRMS